MLLVSERAGAGLFEERFAACLFERDLVVFFFRHLLVLLLVGHGVVDVPDGEPVRGERAVERRVGVAVFEEKILVRVVGVAVDVAVLAGGGDPDFSLAWQRERLQPAEPVAERPGEGGRVGLEPGDAVVHADAHDAVVAEAVGDFLLVFRRLVALLAVVDVIQQVERLVHDLVDQDADRGAVLNAADQHLHAVKPAGQPDLVHWREPVCLRPEAVERAVARVKHAGGPDRAVGFLRDGREVEVLREFRHRLLDEHVRAAVVQCLLVVVAFVVRHDVVGDQIFEVASAAGLVVDEIMDRAGIAVSAVVFLVQEELDLFLRDDHVLRVVRELHEDDEPGDVVLMKRSLRVLLGRFRDVRGGLQREAESGVEHGDGCVDGPA